MFLCDQGPYRLNHPLQNIRVTRSNNSISRVVFPNQSQYLASHQAPARCSSHARFDFSLSVSDSAAAFPSLQDVSTNGILLNGHKIRKSSVFLLEGDVFEIPASQSFTCHILKVPLRPKAHLFDPTPPVKPAHKVVGKYKIQSHCLGTGSFASVFLAIDSENYRQVACKTLNIRPHPKQSAPEAEKKKVLKEANLLKSLCHPNINKVLEVAYEDSWIHIFLDLATGGDLFTYITTGGHKDFRLLEGEAKWITYQLMKGLDYLHDLNVSHRDLKPENVLLCAPGPYPRVIIADFGLARQKAWQATLNAVGTVPYMSPEAILALANPKSKYVGMPADCWSLGCCKHLC
ncbi:kinase-like protein [Sistotremastrum suecicum HHB10207 ss-3]|uniref:non-specific serine/threonine protein kinase n=1 Tax=Sistotremastrum suecicum HHB10207 ss-3 TaxID=1314776 RepID=A0A166ASM7_9AGAM|nr:kinase-like protein [Sistotremastrum suecicum HHB10207 ss-3]